MISLNVSLFMKVKIEITIFKWNSQSNLKRQIFEKKLVFTIFIHEMLIHIIYTSIVEDVKNIFNKLIFLLSFSYSNNFHHDYVKN